MVNTAVLFITFSRPEYARQSFDAIKSAQPRKLYFYSNKGRSDKLNELDNNNTIRGYVNEIDWDCELKTFFRNEYVDVYASLRGAIDWIFENEKEAIILEEDCVATLAFFEYCDKLLPVYKNEPKVWMISGDNFTPQANPLGETYFLTRYMHIYGWATWAERWHNQDKLMLNYTDLSFKDVVKYYNSILKAIISRMYWGKVFKNFRVYNPWDHIFTYNMVRNKAYSLIPTKNLVYDIGVVGVHNVHNEKKLNAPDFDFLQNEYKIDWLIKPLKGPFDKYDNYHFKFHILFPLIKRKISLLIRLIS